MIREDAHLGKLLIEMMATLQHRGADSAGIAIYSEETTKENDEYAIRILTQDVIGAMGKISSAIAEAGGDIRSVHLNPVNGHGLDKYLVKSDRDELKRIIDCINATNLAKVFSVGQRLEIIKDVCTAKELDNKFGISHLRGSHGLGHVRFSTESLVDLFHAHPFQTFSYPDVAVVHNGQITNYYKMRTKLEGNKRCFDTDNDSELIVHYITNKLEQGFTLKEALDESIKDLDGPFSYIVSTSDAIGVARDKLGLRPALILESQELRAVASEENALRVIGNYGNIRNLKPGESVTWQKF